MDYWIGDLIKIKSTGHIGKFEGFTASGNLKIKVGSHFVEVTKADTEIYEEPEEDDPALEFTEDQNTSSLEDELNFSAVLDLHIESLDPSRTNEDPRVIKSFQLKKCEAFIQTAIKMKAPQITIIHGKGTGSLKAEVLHLLSHTHEVFIIQEISNGGAQECIMKY